MVVPSYFERFAHFAKMHRSDDGVLTIRFHTADGPWILRADTRDLFTPMFFEIAQDRANRAIVLTGTGNVFCAELAQDSLAEELGRFGPEMLDNWRYSGNCVVREMLSIEAPVILALNGDLFQHAEIWLSADIVIAADQAHVQDFHMVGGQAPGGNASVVFETLLGHARAKRFLLTGQKLSAKTLFEWGAISEIAAPSDVLPRATALASDLIKQNRHVLRYAKAIVTQRLRAQIQAEESYSQALVMLGAHSSIPEILKANAPQRKA